MPKVGYFGQVCINNPGELFIEDFEIFDEHCYRNNFHDSAEFSDFSSTSAKIEKIVFPPCGDNVQ